MSEQAKVTKSLEGKRVADPNQLYRIYWHVRRVTGEEMLTGQIHRSTDMYSLEMAEFWVNHLNRDESNKAAGLEYWLEEENPIGGSSPLMTQK